MYYVELDKRSKFEKQNENIAVTVLGYSWRISKENIRTHVINLLLIADKKKKYSCLINNMCRLLSS